MPIRFGSYRLDDHRFLLEREGVRVSIRPKVFDLLAYLVRDRDRVVPREELVEVLWGGAAVGTGSLSGLVNELRKLLGEDGRGPSSIRTVHARGYQFVASVDEADSQDHDEIFATHEPAAVAPLAVAPLKDALSERPEALPIPVAEALWKHLREDADRIHGLSEWLGRLSVAAVSGGRFERLDWAHDRLERDAPIRQMRRVEAESPRVRALGDGDLRSPSESTRS